MTEVTRLEKDAIVAEFKFKSVLIVECAWCKQIMGYKDGHGVVGPTSGLCDSCKSLGRGYFI